MNARFVLAVSLMHVIAAVTGQDEEIVSSASTIAKSGECSEIEKLDLRSQRQECRLCAGSTMASTVSQFSGAAFIWPSGSLQLAE